MVNQKIIIGILAVVILLSGAILISMPGVKMRIDQDKATFYVQNENNRWVVAGREYSLLFDGTSKMNRRVSNITVESFFDFEKNTTTIVRTTPYIRGPVITDTWFFNGSVNEKELFPVYHKVNILNGSGFFYRYEVRDLDYIGSTNYNAVSPQKFGKNMEVSWEGGSRWAHVYQVGILKVQYGIDSDNETFDVKLFDPISPPDNVGTGTTSALINNMVWFQNISCGDDMEVIVGIAIDSEPTASVNTITYNGASLSKINRSLSSDGQIQAEMWNLTNPDCGILEQFVATFTNPTTEEAAAISAVYYGVDYINLSSVSANASDSSTSSSLNTPSSSENNWVVNIFALDFDAGSGISVSGDNAVQRGFSDEGAVTLALADGNDSDGTVTMGWSGFSDEWVQIGVELIPVSAIVDDEYPIFFNFFDDNASLVGSGTGNFNVSVNLTNGTVVLEIDGTNTTASNMTANLYNVSYLFSSSGNYPYRWHSWGNGTNANYNVSGDRTYTVNATPDTCSPSSPLTGNYLFDCADNCVITSDIDAGGYNVTINGTGTFVMQANITNWNEFFIYGTDSSNICDVTCTLGCYF